MPPLREIRADHDRETIVVYQAYNDAIADAAVAAQRFVPPFSVGRMTWIKPSFLWLMVRSDWGSKANQTRILAVRIGLADWTAVLRQAVLTDHTDEDGVDPASVRVQWDPERSLQGAKLDHRSIQVGIGRALATPFASEWVREIRDLTDTAHKIRRAVLGGDVARARGWLPPERVWDAPADVRRRLGMGETA